ncbi:MAG: MaoC family dehydratase [Chloroflexi bacterium]|nr:MaoC family dehydratase [Chloroflexota bacterium]
MTEKPGTIFGEGDTLTPVVCEVTQGRVDRYAKASGDFNPIHVDEKFAAGSHFGKRVAHGMLVAAQISEMMTQSFGHDWLRNGRLKLRFKAPVYPGDVVTSRGVVKSVNEVGGLKTVVCNVEVVRQTEEFAITGEASVVISGGRA